MSKVNLAISMPFIEKKMDTAQTQIANVVVEDRAIKPSLSKRMITSSTTLVADKTIAKAKEKDYVSYVNSTASTVNNRNMSNTNVSGNTNDNTLLFNNFN